MNSKLQVMAQRLAIIEKNEQIIGRTLIGNSKTIKELETAIAELKSGAVAMSGAAATAASESAPSGKVEEFEKSLSDFNGMMDQFNETLSETHDTMAALSEQVGANLDKIDTLNTQMTEMKYVIDQLNPLSLVTIDKVSDLVEEKIDEYIRKKKKD